MPQPWMPASSGASEASAPSDVKEVWFSGAHSNVGGGEFKYDGGRTPALAHLSLRWMLREAVEAGFEVDLERVLHSPLFEPFIDRAHAALAERALRGEGHTDLERFLERALRRNAGLDLHIATIIFLASRECDESTAAALAPRASHTSFKLQHPLAPEAQSVAAKLGEWWSRVGSRSMTAFWWLLEVSPSVKVVWDPEGNTRRWTIRCVGRSSLSFRPSTPPSLPPSPSSLVLPPSCSLFPSASTHSHLSHRSNNGKGRPLPSHPLLHFSVLERLEADPSVFANTGNNENYPEGHKYKIKAKFVQGESPYTCPIEQ